MNEMKKLHDEINETISTMRREGANPQTIADAVMEKAKDTPIAASLALMEILQKNAVAVVRCVCVANYQLQNYVDIWKAIGIKCADYSGNLIQNWDGSVEGAEKIMEDSMFFCQTMAVRYLQEHTKTDLALMPTISKRIN